MKSKLVKEGIMFCIRLNSSIKISHTVNMKDDVVNSQMCVCVFLNTLTILFMVRHSYQGKDNHSDHDNASYDANVKVNACLRTWKNK